MTYTWLMPLIPAVGAIAIVYALRWFPIAKPSDGQMEFDYSSSEPRYRSVMAERTHIAAGVVREEARRIKNLPPVKR